MIVVLHGVGRNLNRAYRTCEAFGVEHLWLWNCSGKLAGNLYAAKGRVQMRVIDMPCPNTTLALETTYTTPLPYVDWTTIDTILVGGETCGIPNVYWHQKACIPMHGKVSGLTVEAALAIALYAWREYS